MKLWPAYTASFTTSLSVKDAVARLHAEIGQLKSFEITNSGPWDSYVKAKHELRDFIGEKHSDGGQFVRNMNTIPGELRAYNSFQAFTRCTIEAADKGANVRAHMRVALLPMIFLGIWNMVMLLACAFFLIAPIDAGSRSAALIPLGMATAFWLIVCFAFSEDAERMERLLRANLERE